MIEFDINRILVPVDFSPASINALDTVIALARQHDATILLLNVVETNILSGLPGDAYLSEITVRALIGKSENELQFLQNSITSRFMLPCEAITTTGFLSSSINKISADNKIDMIIMGTHGTLGFKDLFIGSNAYNVVKNSVCPVLTVPLQSKWQSFKNILFPVRAIPAALEKYDFVRKIIRKDNATVKILGLATDYERDGDVLKELASRMNDKLRDDKVKASTYFKVGRNMAEEVIKMATIMKTHLIVITASVDTSVKEFFAGNYTQHIINHAPFPVLSIKPFLQNDHVEEVTTNRQAFSQKIPLYN